MIGVYLQRLVASLGTRPLPNNHGQLKKKALNISIHVAVEILLEALDIIQMIFGHMRERERVYQ